MSNQKFSNNASKFAQKCAGVSGTGVSRQQITFSYQDGISKDKENKKTGEMETIYQVRKATRDENGIVPAKKLSINWQQTEKGQELILIQDGVVVATFATLITREIEFNPYPIWDEPNVYIAIPTLSSFNPIESTSVGNFFTQWLTSMQFFEHISLLSERGTYAPQLGKMTFLLISYLIARDNVITENESIDVYTRDIIIDKELLVSDYLDFLKLLTDDDQTPKMKKLFRNAKSVLELAPASETPAALKPATDGVVDVTISPTAEDTEFDLQFKELIESQEETPQPPTMLEVSDTPTIDIAAEPVKVEAKNKK